jgi:hypothetical protein
VVALFCDDVREEKAGTDTLVGIFPDNVVVAEVPTSIPKVSIYFRFHGAVVAPVTSLQFLVTVPWSDEPILKHDVSREVIEKGVEESKINGLPLFGIISRITTYNWVVEKSGIVLVKAIVNDSSEIVCGQLRIVTNVKADTIPEVP